MADMSPSGRNITTMVTLLQAIEQHLAIHTTHLVVIEQHLATLVANDHRKAASDG
jgi:hypothetical protein